MSLLCDHFVTVIMMQADKSPCFIVLRAPTSPQEPRSSRKPLFHWPFETQLLLLLGLGAISIVFVLLFSLSMV